MKFLCVFVLCLTFATPSLGEMVRQCLCSEIEECKSQYVNSIIPCADQCQSYVQHIGASYPALRKCLIAREPKLIQTMKCVEAKYANSCAKVPGEMVLKRYPETLKIAAMAEINSMVTKMGIANQVRDLMSTGKKLFSCIRKCVERSAGACGAKLGCGLSLPADNVLVQNAKECAIASGFNTQELQSICNCAVQAGVRQLAGICEKIQIV